MSEPQDSRLANAMSVDVEEWFQVSAFENRISRNDWRDLESRVEANTSKILDLFAGHEVKATFFCLGWIAERHPALVREIVAQGHELASHGYSHIRATEQSPSEFSEDIKRTKALLEDVGGKPVLGYRAASFSIGRNNLWAIDCLREAGYEYSSSIFPVTHDVYGMPEAPRFSFRCPRTGLLEIPITTVKFLGRNAPCGGGGYFRLLPYRYFRWAIGHVNTREHRSAVFYLHPWEIDPDQPRQHGLSWKSRFRHYNNLSRTYGRLDRLLGEFRWGRMDEIFLHGAHTADVPHLDLRELHAH